MPAKKTTILVADDDLQLLRLIARNLQFEGYEALTAINGRSALEIIKTKKPDLVLLDVMMPHMDGFTVTQHVRQFSNVPIIIITAHGQDQDIIRGLDLGADDYLTKPFNLDELLARARAVLRRSQFMTSAHAVNNVTIGNLQINFKQHVVERDNQEITLTPIEYRLLSYLAQHVGQVVLQDVLLEHVWGPEYAGENHMLQVNVNRLRRKIEPDISKPRYILTKVGVGYMLTDQPAIE